MDLKKKLARLDGDTSRSEPVSSSDDTPAPRSETLDDLRSKMAAILGRKPRPVREVASPSETLLPFFPVETRAGVVHHRREHLPPSHHVGTIPADAALTASPEMLALLALDPQLAGCDPSRAVYLDTETTGLGGGAGTIAFLVGLLWFDGGRTVFEQLLLRTPAEEPGMLDLLEARLAAASMVVTYNGKSFDLPLLDSRFIMNRREPPPRLPHLDLVHVARRLHKERIGGCSLKMVESSVLGFERDDDIDGMEVAPRYAHFLRTGDEGALGAVVEHNAWDIVSMAAIVGLYGEPLDTLHEQDLLGLARTYRRARELDRAHEVATLALERGAGPAARQLRGEIAKARGDRAAALSDFETLSAEVDDDDVRLELAKLYEHYVKEPVKALEVVSQGTGEAEPAVAKRRARLERKIDRKRRR